MIKDILGQRIIHDSDKPFITHEDQKISYLRFHHMVNGLYHTLNTKANQYVGLQINNKLKLLIAIIALNRKKSIPVVYPDYPNIDEHIKAIKIPVLIKDFAITEDCNDINTEYSYCEDDTQMVMFTSGSSGLPKPCELTYQNFYESSKMWNQIIEFKNSDVYLNHMPLVHVSGMCIIFRALYYNFEVILDNFSVDNYTKYHHKVNIVSMVPAMLNKILDQSRNISFMSKKAIIVGGNNIDRGLLKTVKAKKIPAYISYGLTESCSGIAGAWIDEYCEDRLYNAHPQVKFNLLDGMLNISSPTIIKKYLNSIKLFRNQFTTSDQVKIFNKNKFLFIGRSDNVIISGGENIAIKYVEKIFMQFKKISFCSVEIVEDKHWGQVMHATIESNNALDLAKFKEELKDYLPNHMIPKKISLK
tara:strand:- start:25201 stop:26448 length:1248 start_codon:yes stop_codon:yes gene_type:complete